MREGKGVRRVAQGNPIGIRISRRDRNRLVGTVYWHEEVGDHLALALESSLTYVPCQSPDLKSPILLYPILPIIE